jgi:uncharacterized protein YbjT (DUF2867 family)
VRNSLADASPILLIGATRGTGLLIARLLIDRGCAIRVLARDPARAKSVFGSGVEVVAGDLTKGETLAPAVTGAQHIIFTAGCRSGHPATEKTIKATEYEGTLRTLDAAARAGFAGRFMYMTSSGVGTHSLMSFGLNMYKGNTLHWRRRAEEAIRRTSADYTIIRTGILLNRDNGGQAIHMTQSALPLSLRYRIGRPDVAKVFVASLDEPRASRTTFEIVWGGAEERVTWQTMLTNLKPDELRREP